MKKIIVILAVLTSFNLYSQEREKHNRLGIFFALDKNVSPKYIEYNEFNTEVIEFDYNRNNYKIGLKTEHELNNSFSVNSGINFSNKSHDQTSYCKNCDYLIAPRPKKIKIHLLEVPLSFKYLILKRKIKIYTDIGVINQLVIQSKNIDNKYLISGKLAGGLEFDLGEKTALQIMAEYYNGLRSLYKDFDYKIKSISFGISLIKTN